MPSHSIQLQHLSEQLHFVSYFSMLRGFLPRRYNTSWWMSYLKVIPPSLHLWNLLPLDEGLVLQIPTVAYGMIVVPTMRTFLMFLISRALPPLKRNSLRPTWFGRIILQPITCQLYRLSTYIILKVTWHIKTVMWLKIHVNSLFNRHIVGCRRIPPNRVGGKLCPPLSYIHQI